VTSPVDIAVVGSGAAGLAAAVTSARAGANTLLLDQHPEPGGTGGHSGLTTLCGLYDDVGQHLNDGFPREFADALSDAAPMRMGKVWVLNFRPTRFRELSRRYLTTTPRLRLLSNTPLTTVVTSDRRIVTVNGFHVRAVVDCTGTAEVARAIGAACLETDATTQAPAVLFPLLDVDRVLDTPAAAAQVMLPLARAGFPPVQLQPGPDPGLVAAKFTGPAGRVPELIEFLRRHVRGFESCRTEMAEVKTAHRAGRMIVGRHLLTGEEVRCGRRFPDAVARSAWPIEQWGEDGVARMRYLPPGRHYDIPARALQARDCGNLFMAGKTISADVEAIASARVMGCCLATGAAAGKLAAVRQSSDAEHDTHA